MFRVGDEVEVYVLKVDQESKKIALSLRRAQPEQWEEIVSRYREGQIVPGQVTKLAPFGAFVRLDGPIEGLIHISELVDRRVNHPQEVINEEDVVPVKIVRIEHDRHRLGLSLRQARDKAEEDGWEFNDSGGVRRAPDEVLAQLGVEVTSIASEEAAAPAEYAAEEAEEPAEAVATEESVSGELAVAEDVAEAVEEAEVEEATVALEGLVSEEPAVAEDVAEPVEAPAEDAAEAVEAPVEEVGEAVEEEPIVEAEAAAEEPSEVADEPSAEDGTGEDIEAEVLNREDAGVTHDTSKALNKVDGASAEEEEGQVEAEESEEQPSG
jgi:predicted RNA-binding protein with RPS1 domain